MASQRLIRSRPAPLPWPRAGLGESPVWDPRTNRLRWVDLFDGVLHDSDPVSGDDDARSVDAACGFVVLADDGIAYAQGSRVMCEGSTGLRELVEFDPSGPLRLNDSQVSPGGWLFCGLMSTDREDRVGTGRLVRVGAAGSVESVSEKLSIPNGLGWSPDGRTMYHVDTAGRQVDRFDFDPLTGEASQRRHAFGTEDVGGMPDGLAVDGDGRIWLAHFGTPFVVCTDDTGAEIDRVELPVANVTSCCFGGDDLSTLFVTTSTREATGNHPHAGAVFTVETAARGQEPKYFGRTN